jgi:hypothetical protein
MLFGTTLHYIFYYHIVTATRFGTTLHLLIILPYCHRYAVVAPLYGYLFYYHIVAAMRLKQYFTN